MKVDQDPRRKSGRQLANIDLWTTVAGLDGREKHAFVAPWFQIIHPTMCSSCCTCAAFASQPINSGRVIMRY